MRSVTLGYAPLPVQCGTVIVSRRAGSVTAAPFIARVWKRVWWMWKTWSSCVRFSTVQSSVVPWCRVIAGGAPITYATGVWPCTVM